MAEFKYILSVLTITVLTSILILIIYGIRAHIPKGPYTWMSNLYSCILFLIATVFIFIAISNFSTKEVSEEESVHLTEVMRQELSFEFSMIISKFAMFPLLVVEMLLVVYLNLYLIWIWYRTGQWDTVVNKFIIMQRMAIISIMIALVMDYSIRLFRPQTLLFMSKASYCFCVIFLYQALTYASICACLAAAVVRLFCVKYPLEFHNRLVFKILMIFTFLYLSPGILMMKPRKDLFTLSWKLHLLCHCYCLDWKWLI